MASADHTEHANLLNQLINLEVVKYLQKTDPADEDKETPLSLDFTKFITETGTTNKYRLVQAYMSYHEHEKADRAVLCI